MNGRLAFFAGMVLPLGLYLAPWSTVLAIVVVIVIRRVQS
jgi:hypothetical protein